MLIPAAICAGISVPTNLDSFASSDYPHWSVFCLMQLGQPMPSAHAHFDNAGVVASISHDDIFTVTAEDLIARGFSIGHAIP